MIPVNQGRMVSEVRLKFDRRSDSIDLQARFVPLDGTVSDDQGMGELARRAQAAIDDFKRGK